MALSKTSNRQEFIPTNGQTDFQFTLPFFNVSDIKVSILLANGNIVPDSDFSFTVSPINNNIELGADVTITISPDLTTSDKVVIFREVPYTQEYDLQEGSTIVPTALNKTFDRVVAQNQQQNDQLNRTVVFPETDPSTATYTVGSTIQRANTALGFDNDGNVTELNLFNLEAGAADTSKGIKVTNSIIAGKVDNTTMQFDNNGNFSVKGIPFAKLNDVINDDTMATATSTNLSTSEAIKAYIDSKVVNSFPRFIEINGITTAPTTSGSYWTTGSTSVKPPSDTGTFIEFVNNFGQADAAEYTLTTKLAHLASTAETDWQSKCYGLLVRAATTIHNGPHATYNSTTGLYSLDPRKCFVRTRYYRGGSSTLYKDHIIAMQSNAILSDFHDGQYASGDIGQTIGNSNDCFIPVTQAMRDGEDIYFKITVEGNKNATSTNSGDNARIHIKGAMLQG
jgi:hypothetical protein